MEIGNTNFAKWIRSSDRYRCSEFLRARPETHVVVAAHSAFLLTLLNAVLEVEVDDDASWFDTGEMRTFVLEWKSKV